MEFQTVLIVILSLLTINLIVVGIYLILVLKEFRTTVLKMNKILDTVDEITDSVSRPIETIAAVVDGVTSALGVVSLVSSLKGKKKEE